jgi:hypothetical protein
MRRIFGTMKDGPMMVRKVRFVHHRVTLCSRANGLQIRKIAFDLSV